MGQLWSKSGFLEAVFLFFDAGALFDARKGPGNQIKATFE